MTGDDKMPCFDMLYWLLRLWCHQVVCDECLAPSSSCRHSETESGLCLWQGRKSGLLRIYVYILFFSGRKGLQPHNIFFSFLFFFLSLHMLSVIRTVNVPESLGRNVVISCPGFCHTDKRHMWWLCQHRARQ